MEGWVKVMERIARETYEGKLKPGELDEQHILLTYQELNKATGTGYGNDWYKVNESTGAPAPEVLKMQQNIFRFSQAKDAVMLEDINRLLTKDGKLSNWQDFKAGVLRLNKKYNVNYLQAEWQTARHAGYMANLWQEYLDNANLFPNLKYKTQEDERVRLEHEALNNTIASIDSPFWNEFYPPNGWRCRCYVVQTAEPETPEDKMPVVSPEDVKPEFRLNVGKSGQVFKEGTENGGKQHSYFALKKLLQNESENYRIAFELTKHNAPYHKIKGTNVRESLFADMRTPSRTDNLNEAKLISKNLKLAVDILPLINLKKHSSPEFRINGIIGDGVKRQGAITNTVSNAFKHKLGKRGQLSGLEKTFIAVNYGEVANLSNREFKRIVNSIYGRMTNNKQVEFLIISFNQKSVMIHAKDIPADSKEGHAYISKILSTLKNPKRSE